jgi:hypothetical protein
MKPLGQILPLFKLPLEISIVLPFFGLAAIGSYVFEASVIYLRLNGLLEVRGLEFLALVHFLQIEVLSIEEALQREVVRVKLSALLFRLTFHLLYHLKDGTLPTSNGEHPLLVPRIQFPNLQGVSLLDFNLLVLFKVFLE